MVHRVLHWSSKQKKRVQRFRKRNIPEGAKYVSAHLRMGEDLQGWCEKSRATFEKAHKEYNSKAACAPSCRSVARRISLKRFRPTRAPHTAR